MLDLSPSSLTKWNDRLAMDVALLLEGSGSTLAEVLEYHSIDENDMARFKDDPLFVKKVGHYRDEVRDKGMTFRMKARAQAEELLLTSWSLIHHPDVSASVKADLIKQTVKWGGLEPKNDVGDLAGGGGVTITINLGNASKELPQQADMVTIDAVPESQPD